MNGGISYEEDTKIRNDNLYLNFRAIDNFIRDA